MASTAGFEKGCIFVPDYRTPGTNHPGLNARKGCGIWRPALNFYGMSPAPQSRSEETW
jgi:hypothetical protein